MSFFRKNHRGNTFMMDLNVNLHLPPKVYTKNIGNHWYFFNENQHLLHSAPCDYKGTKRSYLILKFLYPLKKTTDWSWPKKYEVIRTSRNMEDTMDSKWFTRSGYYALCHLKSNRGCHTTLLPITSKLRC